MAETSIEWTERSWNPIVGCTIVSPGCTNCYAMGIVERFKDVYRGRKWAGAPAEAMTRRVNGKAVWTGQLTLAPDHILTEPLRRRKPTTYFVNSMGDLFHEHTPDEWIDQVFAVMALASQHTFQVLTKRSARMRNYLNRAELPRTIATTSVDLPYPDELVRIPSWPLRNVWLGVSAEDQKRANERIPDLLDTPAVVRFVSAEPLLGPIDFEDIDDGERDDVHLRFDALSGLAFDGEGAVDGVFGNPDPKLDWIIVGGESGPGARPMHPNWPRQIRDQCAAAGSAFFFKQWGEWLPDDMTSETAEDLDVRNRYAAIGDQQFARAGKKAAGRLLDGVEHNAMPGQVRAP